MNTFILENHLPNNELHWIEKCKSKMMTIGYPLRQAHYVLGGHIATEINKSDIKHDLAILILMRAGLNFGLGIADTLEHLGRKVSIYFIYNDCVDQETLNAIQNKIVILVDAVINSGKSIERVLNQLSTQDSPLTIITTTVIPENALDQFGRFNLMTVRTSKNQYKGAKRIDIKDGKGPDTGDRLFGTLL